MTCGCDGVVIETDVGSQTDCSQTDCSQTGGSRTGCTVVEEVARQEVDRQEVARQKVDRPCGHPVADGAPITMCAHHLLVAHDFIARDVGVTDTLRYPCAACGSRLGVRYPSGWLCAICEWRVGDIPDGESVPPRVDVVYYLRYRDRIKIGTSANPRQRFAGLLYDEVLAFERGDRLLEQRRHAQFAPHRIPRTEWFEANEALAEHVRTVADGVTDPWAHYALWVSQASALRG